MEITHYPPQPRAPAQLKQIQVAYDPLQDRLLIRLNVSQQAEYRLWFTRRLVAMIWQPLVHILAQTTHHPVHHSPAARAASLAFEHQSVIQSADFSQKYQEDASHWPLGKEPLLVIKLEIRPSSNGQFAFRFHPPQGEVLNLSLPRATIHSLCKLLMDASNTGNWGLNLNLGEPLTPPTLQ